MPLNHCCSKWSLCVNNVNETGCTFSDIHRLVRYNYSYSSNIHSLYSKYMFQLLPYLCYTLQPGNVLFLLRDAMLARYTVLALCLSTCPSVRQTTPNNRDSSFLLPTIFVKFNGVTVVTSTGARNTGRV